MQFAKIMIWLKNLNCKSKKNRAAAKKAHGPKMYSD